MLVKNFRRPAKERIYFITPDGEEVNLHDPPRLAVLNMSGWGLIGPLIQTTKGPAQHGASVVNILAAVREISMKVDWTGCSRDEYITLRNKLINTFRFSRTVNTSPVAGTLYWFRDIGDIRAVDVFLQNELPMEMYREGSWSEWSLIEELNFLAPNPAIYDPTTVTSTNASWTPAVQAELTFPIAFPITFDNPNASQTKTFTINYAGNFEEYPTITIEGPGGELLITNTTTGKTIELYNYTIATGETVTIDLDYAVKSISSDVNGSLNGYLTDDSDLGTFKIEPDPLATDGTNTITVRLYNPDGNTSVTIEYNNRYIGV